MFKVTFSFEDGSVVEHFANAGDNLLELAREANVAIDAPCSGNASCGKCRVQLKKGELDSKKTLHISDEEYQEKQMEVLEAIKMFSDMGLNSTGGLSNNSNGMPKNIRPIMDSALVAMAMMQGLTSAIVNPNDLRLMETIKSCDVFKGNTLYADSYLEL